MGSGMVEGWEEKTRVMMRREGRTGCVWMGGGCFWKGTQGREVVSLVGIFETRLSSFLDRRRGLKLTCLDSSPSLLPQVFLSPKPNFSRYVTLLPTLPLANEVSRSSELENSPIAKPWNRSSARLLPIPNRLLHQPTTPLLDSVRTTTLEISTRCFNLQGSRTEATSERRK